MVESTGTSPDTQIAQEIRELLQPVPFIKADERVRYYIDQAEAALAGEQDDERVESLRWLVSYGNETLRALRRDDTDQAMQLFDWLHQEREKANIPFFEAQARSKQSRAAGKASRRGPGSLRVVLEAITEEIGTAASDNVLTWWERHRDENDAVGGVGCQFLIWFDGDCYRYDHEGEQTTATRKQIQDALSKIRNL